MKNTIYQIISQKDYNPLKAKDFYFLLSADNQQARREIDEALLQLENEGELIKNAKNKYIRCDESARTLAGTFLSAKSGYGFVRLKIEPKRADVYIAAHNTLGAQNHDEVTINIIRPATESTKAEGRVIRITKEADRTRVGVCEVRNGSILVHLSDNTTALLEKEAAPEDINGCNVRVELLHTDEAGRSRARLISVIGKADEPMLELKTAISHYELPTEFSQAALAQARELSKQTDIDMAKRTDLRKLNTMSIDSASAKDLDDAVSIIEREDGYELYVSIADVSYYVAEDSPIDRDARERGTSVYFPNTAIHMLPSVLCESLCSLSPDTDKAAFTVKLRYDKSGKLLESDFFRSVIRSRAKLAYDKVNRLLAGDVAGLPEEYAVCRADLLSMQRLSELLIDQAKKRGSIDLDLPEAELIVDKDYNVEAVRLRERGVSERLIEAFMLAANSAVAEFIHDTGTPSLYRSHEEPDRDKLVNFKETANLFGYRLRIREHHYAGELNKFLNQISGTPSEYVFRKMLLRCMKKAEYSAESPSHFALAYRCYTHFTSPIRRYPDLIVHRILSRLIEGTMSEEYLQYLSENITSLAEQTSLRERIAEQAERECEDMLCAKYMRNHLGEEFPAVVSGVVRSGLFVQLANLIEGFVPFDSIDSDYYTVDLDHMRLIGTHTGRIIHLGERLIVAAENAEIITGQIEFRVIRFMEDNTWEKN